MLYLIPSTLAEKETVNAVIPNDVQHIIKSLDYFLVENVKTARRFLKAVDQSIVIDDLTFEILDKKTSEDDALQMILPLLEGKKAGVISEAGCPGIADPGALAVEMCHQNNIPVVPLVGPSSILLALMASGMNGQGFTFHGYLPIDKRDRAQKIKELDRLAVQTGSSQIFMETPYRNNQLLDDIIKNCAKYSKLCIASNITSSEEYIKTKAIIDWKSTKVDLNKKPTIFVLGK